MNSDVLSNGLMEYYESPLTLINAFFKHALFKFPLLVFKVEPVDGAHCDPFLSFSRDNQLNLLYGECN